MSFLGTLSPGPTKTTPIIPKSVTGPLNFDLNELLGAETTLPNLSALGTGSPELNVPGMDPTQAGVLGNFLATAEGSPDLAAARAQLSELTSGPIGSSPATVAGMKAFEDLQAPQIASDSALRGTAGGGQGLEALALGRTAAAVPLIEQEISNREAAVGQYASIGQQQIQSMAQALEASGLPREIALQQAEALFQQQQQNWQAQMGLQTQALGWEPQLIGQKSQKEMSWGDIIAGANPTKSLESIGGMFGGGKGG